jgi:hypothetical protein
MSGTTQAYHFILFQRRMDAFPFSQMGMSLREMKVTCIYVLTTAGRQQIWGCLFRLQQTESGGPKTGAGDPKRGICHRVIGALLRQNLWDLSFHGRSQEEKFGS